MNEQLEDIYPSAKAPLYRRINSDEGLSYLRDDDGIIGFELDLHEEQRLSGFLLLAIQKHTVYAFKSDLHEPSKLILFPPLDKLFDSTFEMLGLKVLEKRYESNDFIGKELSRGSLREVVRDLTPPEKDIDLPLDVSERMAQEMERVRLAQEDSVVAVVQDENIVDEPPEESNIETPDHNAPDMNEMMDEPDMNEMMDEPDMNHFEEYEGGFDEYESGFDDVHDEGEVEEFIEEVVEDAIDTDDWRIISLERETFSSLSEVGEFVELRLHVPKAVSTQVLNKALQSEFVVNKQMKSQDLAVMLFNKLFEDGKL